MARQIIITWKWIRGTIRWVFKTAQTFHQLKRLTFARFLPLVKKDKIKSSKLSGSLCPIYRKLNLFQPLLFHLVLNDPAMLRMDGEGWSVVYYVKSKSLTQSHPRSEKPRFFAAFQPFSCNAAVSVLNIFLNKTCLLINSLIIPTIPAAVHRLQQLSQKIDHYCPSRETYLPSSCRMWQKIANPEN